MTEVLLTFTGFHDPYFRGNVNDDELPGPILSLMSHRRFERVYLFDTPATSLHTERTKQAIEKLYRDIQVSSVVIPLNDPTSYEQILSGVRSLLPGIIQDCEDANFSISVASGTPQMHSCWLLLSASGEIPARIINIRPPQFVTKDHPLIKEVDLSDRVFPRVRSDIIPMQIDDKDQPSPEDVQLRLGIVGDHPAILEVLETSSLLAPSQSPVLILGETGTGKELLARYIHELSGRAKSPFIAVNCAAIPEDLVESILFGHRKGAFTGALKDQTGKFDAANGGTLFLDEIGELPMPSQAKLLRVLQDGQVESLGDQKTHPVDVRLISATNRDLRKLVKTGKFRNDLYYRLNVGEVVLPSLRERRSDIPKIALRTLDQVNQSLKRPKRLTSEALSRLQSHNWEGNIRDLQNVIERSVRLCRADVLDADDLLITEPITYSDPLDALPDPYEGFSLESFLGSARKQMILRALEISDGNQSRAARLLGISPQAVHKFLHKSEEDSSTGVENA
ncbi:MAG: sigma 54-interacting transcriptional regulator [Caldisericales bacterium]|nr:sigma 54-interacting transcriptional regulator [Caldisericales bacterium]